MSVAAVNCSVCWTKLVAIGEGARTQITQEAFLKVLKLNFASIFLMAGTRALININLEVQMMVSQSDKAFRFGDYLPPADIAERDLLINN